MQPRDIRKYPAAVPARQAARPPSQAGEGPEANPGARRAAQRGHCKIGQGEGAGRKNFAGLDRESKAGAGARLEALP